MTAWLARILECDALNYQLEMLAPILSLLRMRRILISFRLKNAFS